MDLQSLNHKINNCHDSIRYQMDLIDWENPHTYQWWLSQTSYLVQHTVRLICYATAHVPTEDQTGFKHWLKHLNEEQNHEVLLAKDLSAFNLKYTDFAEFSSTRLIYQNQYYWIQKAHPSTLLGYAFMMEGFAARWGEKYFSIIEKAHGIKASNFIRVHIKEDVAHFQDGIKFLETLPKAELIPLVKNMDQSQLLYCSMIQQIINESRKNTYTSESNSMKAA